MANYVNALVDPWSGVREGANLLMKDRQLKLQEGQLAETQKRNILAGQQADREQMKFDISMMEVPYRFTALKAGHVSNIAKNISGLPREQRMSKYNDLINNVVTKPITVHPQLGELGVINPGNYLPPEDFAKFNDDQQRQYLELVSMTSDQMAALRLSDKNAKAKADEISQRHKNRLEEIRAQGTESRKTEKLKAKYGTSAKDKDTQNRIDKYRKELGNLGAVRERIRKGDKLYQLGQMMARMSGEKNLLMQDNEPIDAALAKVDQYEKWLRKRLRKLESGSSAEDPLGWDK